MVGQEQRISSKMQVVSCKGKTRDRKEGKSKVSDQNQSFCHPEVLLFRIWDYEGPWLRVAGSRLERAKDQLQVERPGSEVGRTIQTCSPLNVYPFSEKSLTSAFVSVQRLLCARSVAEVMLLRRK